jgi:hypothetical protein
VIGFAAHLRVYEPLGAFPDAERQLWTSYVDAGPPSRAVLMAMEHEAGLAAACAVPPRLDLGGERDYAYVRHLDGLTYVCPWRLQLRAWQAVEEFRSELPDEIADAFLPAPGVLAASVEYDAWTVTHPDVQPGIRSCTWSIPLHWFALFESEERRLVLGARGSAGSGGPDAPARTGLDRALVYLTAMSRARRRAARALHVVQRAFDEGPAVEALGGIGRWLEEFHPHSLVELDYGGLVHLMDDDALSADDSVAEIAAALDHLGQSDVGAAGSRYEAVVDRWRAIAALEHAN